MAQKIARFEWDSEHKPSPRSQSAIQAALPLGLHDEAKPRALMVAVINVLYGALNMLQQRISVQTPRFWSKAMPSLAEDYMPF